MQIKSINKLEHNHNHIHSHDYTVINPDVNKAFIAGIILNFLFVIVEVIVGLVIHSLSLLSDAGHNFTDVGALALSLLAIRLLKVKSKNNYTYGYRKTSILVALINSMLLLVSIGAIVYEAVNRLFHPVLIQGNTIAVVAVIGICVNSVSAFLFFHNKDSDMNIKSAYLHLLSDAFVSVGIVIGGIAIYYTHWFWLDSVISIIIAVVILVSTWKLLKGSLRLSLDGIPDNIQIDEIIKIAKEVDGVKDIHHIHIWAISTTENAFTAHLVLNNDVNTEMEQTIKDELRHRLFHKNIHHITIETERDNIDCDMKVC